MKKIFYYTDVLPILSKQREALNKINKTLEIFKNSSEEIELVWHPYSRTEEFLKLNKCPAEAEYRKIVEDFKNAGWGVLDEAPTLDEAKKVLSGCDAYYGDSCDLIYEAQKKNIPVMLQDIAVV